MKKKTFAQFLSVKPSRVKNRFNFVSLFSGAGIGDFGLKIAGGKCLAACEIDPNRAEVHKANIGAQVWGNLRVDKEKLIESVKGKSIDLLIATPPCQSFSTANSRRGLREDPEHASKDDRNSLFFEALYVARAIRPSVIIFENVPNFLMRRIRCQGGKVEGRVQEFLSASLLDYSSWQGVICFSELGIPQRRKRSIAIFVRNDVGQDVNGVIQKYLQPSRWGRAVDNVPANLLDLLGESEPLDGKSEENAVSLKDPLHRVPVYSSLHYSWISSIPAGSGRSAWENSCASCGSDKTPFFEVECSVCSAPILTRPHVVEKNGVIRAIKGFKTSYKRMAADDVAPTITTASAHFSSDLKIHPTQNRVLSARECARIQTVPDYFAWPEQQFFRKGYLVREMIGEAIPPLVTYQFGIALSKVLLGLKRSD